MRRIAAIALFGATAIAGAPALIGATAGADDSHTYSIELDNAFGIVEGSELRVAGVKQGSVTDLGVTPDKRAIVTVETSGPLSVLGEDTTCSTEPQSLIAEYFIDCEPRGNPLPDGATISVERTTQTVQTDLVLNTLRAPFRDRLQLVLNEFGTGLAGNAGNLNDAIRRGAPALREIEEVLSIFVRHRRVIRDLQADASEVIGRLAARRGDVSAFVREARDTAVASAERRSELSRDFDLLDDFLAELGPTVTELGRVAREGVPLLSELRDASPGLTRLADGLPGFSDAARVSLEGLGEASSVGTRLLREGKDEVRQLREAGANASGAAEPLADLVRDLDDPDRAVEVDQRAAESTERPAPTGYTGLEGALNYGYYLAGATNQFDQVSHLVHFSFFNLGEDPCGPTNAGGRPGTAGFGVPAQDGGRTTDFLEAHRCVSWLGPNQPGINEPIPLPPYDPSVCPQGSDAPELCDPAGDERATAPAGALREALTEATTGRRPRRNPDRGPRAADRLRDGLGDLLGLPKRGPLPIPDGRGRAPVPEPGRGAANDLLDFLFSP